MLLAVELLIAGMVLYTLRGSGFQMSVASGFGFHHIAFAPKSIAPIAAGSGPNVRIDDVDSHVIVGTSTDGLVHVEDQTGGRGVIWGNGEIEQLQVSRTPDGVRIYRPSMHGLSITGSWTQRIDVRIPPGAHLQIVRSEGDDVSDLQNGVDVTSQDGHISLTNVRGDVHAHSDDGRVTATTIAASSIDLSTDDGRIEASGIDATGAAPHVTMRTSDGSVRISGRFPAAGTYDFSTGDGRIELALLPGSDASIDASTGDGRIDIDGQSYGGAAVHGFRVGHGSSPMRLHSSDGSIHITTNGAQ